MVRRYLSVHNKYGEKNKYIFVWKYSPRDKCNSHTIHSQNIAKHLLKNDLALAYDSRSEVVVVQVSNGLVVATGTWRLAAVWCENGAGGGDNVGRGCCSPSARRRYCEDNIALIVTKIRTDSITYIPTGRTARKADTGVSSRAIVSVLMASNADGENAHTTYGSKKMDRTERKEKKIRYVRDRGEQPTWRASRLTGK